MFGWLYRSVKNQSAERDEIAKAVRAVRAACFGRSCLAKCVKRMTAAAPLRRLRCGGAAAVAALLIVCATTAYADVTCTWQDGRYVCSGEGQTLLVIGGGGGSGNIVTNVVVTNIVGTCTNCVAMSPDYVRRWKSTAHSDIHAMQAQVDYIDNSSIVVVDLLAPYTNHCVVSGLTTFNTVTQTNFLESVGCNIYSQTTPLNPKNAAAQLVIDNRNTASLATGAIGSRTTRAVAFYDGAASMYNQFSVDASASLHECLSINESAKLLRSGLSKLDTMVSELSDEQCTAQFMPGEGIPGGGGSTGGGDNVVTNQLDGNWCTYDQGEAIKDLLEEIKQWLEKQESFFDIVSNRVISIDETIKSALFTSYNHIPTEEDLGMTWQELYLSGYSPNFHEYPATNIVARIELLLAGISGVLTNVSDYASQDEFADESLDSTNLVEDAMGDFTNQFLNVIQSREESTRSVGEALIGLYQKFRTWSGTPFSTENIINSYSVEFKAGESIDVPGFAMPANTLPWANIIRVICRSAMSVIWIFMTVAVFIRFQIAFFQWCFKYVKWAVEVLQGLFV